MEPGAAYSASSQFPRRWRRRALQRPLRASRAAMADVAELDFADVFGDAPSGGGAGDEAAAGRDAAPQAPAVRARGVSFDDCAPARPEGAMARHRSAPMDTGAQPSRRMRSASESLAHPTLVRSIRRVGGVDAA